MTWEEPTMRLELLSAYVPEGNKRLPLSALARRAHLHGNLCWTVSERRVPCMGVDGDEDVCLGMWWDELNRALAALAEGRTHTFEPLLQGIPAFQLERDGATVRLSLVLSATDAGPDPDWQQVPFAWKDFVDAVRSFHEQLRDLLRAEGPANLPEEWRNRLSLAGV